MGNCVGKKESVMLNLKPRPKDQMEPPTKEIDDQNQVDPINDQNQQNYDQQDIQNHRKSSTIHKSGGQKKKKKKQSQVEQVRKSYPPQKPKYNSSLIASSLGISQQLVIEEQYAQSKIQALNSRVSLDFMIEKQRAGPLSVPILSYGQICKIE